MENKTKTTAQAKVKRRCGICFKPLEKKDKIEEYILQNTPMYAHRKCMLMYR